MVSFFSVKFRVKQKSLLNNQQYISAKQGLEFATTAIKSTNLTYKSQQNKLDNSFRNGTLTKVAYDKQTEQLKSQFELDCAPWEIYVKKLSELIEKYSSQSETQGNNKRLLKQSPSISKRSRITFSSSSSDSDTSPPPSTTPKPSTPTTIKYDSSTNTDPLELSLRSSFSSTPNIISFTSQTNHITQRIPLQVNILEKHSILHSLHFYLATQ